MATQGTPVNEAEQWRLRYYDSLAQIEQREKEWREVEALLRQHLSRLTHLADGSGSELDRQLKELRRVLRKSGDSHELNPLMERISVCIAAIDRDQGGAAPPSPRQVLLDLVEAAQFPRQVATRVAEFRKAVTAWEPGDDLRPLAEHFAALIAEEEPAQRHRRVGLLARLFGGGDAEEQAPVAAGPAVPLYHQVLPIEEVLAPARKVLVDFIERLLAPRSADEAKVLGGRLTATATEQELYAVADELASLLGLTEPLQPHEVLLRLLERLAIPADLAPAVEVIKGTLAEGLRGERVEPTLGAIADLMTAMRSRVQAEKEELEAFLKQLTDNLQELDQSIRSAVTTHRASYQDGMQLHTVIQEQVRGLEDSVEAGNDIDTIKRAVQARLSTIRDHMQVFHRAEEGRIALAEREAAELRDRLAAVEKEAGELRERVQEERRQALIDPLTGIPNRLAYNERVAYEFQRWQRYDHPLVLSVWDIDHFKLVNDTYGHQAGDKVLRVIARLLSKQVRKTDLVARFGGEEFVVLMPETGPRDALRVAEALRLTVGQAEFHSHNQRVSITISCGLAAFRAGDGIESVFARADAALYVAKQGGRNRCVMEEG